MNRIVIAEIGINHDGDDDIAKSLISDAFNSGCHAVKFQYRNLSRMYSSSHKEIGDEIISNELLKSSLEIKRVIDLASFAKGLGLLVGISCFTESDFEDVLLRLDLFDFFKVPSVELLNDRLVDSMLNTGKHTYISLGAHDEKEINRSLNRIFHKSNWTPMHCISNYPTSKHNAQLSYILFLQNKWKRRVGFSSHDESWEMCIAALTLGASAIERHITHSKTAPGLDHSTSSTNDEFIKLCEFARSMDVILLGNGPRSVNQGEKINRQNLGRSFFANKDLDVGSKLQKSDFDYLSPQTGLNYQEFSSVLGKRVQAQVKKRTVLSQFHVNKDPTNLDLATISEANRLNLSLPVRLHDYELIRREIALKNFEFHLSFEELNTEIDTSTFDNGHTFSVHTPDYLDSQTLFDPFSLDARVGGKSKIMLEKVIEFAKNLAVITEKPVNLVSSFTGAELDKATFFRELKDLMNAYTNHLVVLTAQWLPPYAWYFGGSVPIIHFNSMEDIKFIEEYEISLTMDTSHLFMCQNLNKINLGEVWSRTLPFIRHLHVADSRGFDGEGLQLGFGNKEHQSFFPFVLKTDKTKVLEIWQGHLDNYEGFKTGIKLAIKLSK